MLAAVTLFASCSQEEIVSKTDGESLVSFTVTTPELGSRAVGDGTTAKNLYYVVYDETLGEQVETISSKTPYAEFKDTKATIKLPLLNGHKYSLIFWAENAEGAYAINWDKKSINLKDATALVSNNENYDAFYAYVAPFTVTGTKSSTIQLKRPFAQLNIGTTDTDLEGVAKYYGIEAFTQSQIVVTAPTAMDLTTGNVSGEEELTYAAAAFISSEKMKETYEYLSMNYLLVSGDKSLMDVDFSITDGTKTISKTFENIPVQRNYKTNIYGDLFTSINEWTVDVAPDFGGEYEPADQLAAVFEKGGEVTLYTDVELTEPLILTEGKTVTVNLNGNTIKSGLFAESNGVISTGTSDSYPFWVQGGTLNIKGEGTIEADDCTYSMAVYATGGEVNIYGGEYYNQGDACDLIYAGGNAEVNIHGGYFKATLNNGADGTENEHSALNLRDADRSTAHIYVLGGTFYKFNPANNVSEGENTNFVKEGYTSVQVGDNYVVTKGTAVADYTGLAKAIESAQDGAIITLATNVDLKGAPLRFNKGKAITIDLNGNNITADIFTESNGTISAGTSDSYAFWVENGTLNITGEGIVKTQACKYSMAVYATGGVVNISGGEFYNAGEGSDLIYASGTGEGDSAQGAIINISGGVFKANKKQAFVEGTDNEYSTLNIKDYYRGAKVSGKVDVPATKYAQINVTGGSFYKFNPANNVSEGANTNFVSADYVSTAKGDWYVVSK